jgi:hypothetical protein
MESSHSTSANSAKMSSYKVRFFLITMREVQDYYGIVIISYLLSIVIIIIIVKLVNIVH